MAKNRIAATKLPRQTRAEIASRPAQLVDPYVADLEATFGKYRLPPEEAARVLDEAARRSGVTLTELLYQMRRERP